MWLSKKEEEIDAIAKKWASVISDKYVRQQAEEAARIALRHGIKDLPELREADLGKISKYHGIRASFQEGMTDELPSIIHVNKRGYRGWKEAHANAVRYGQLVQDNPLLHELGHYIDYCNDSANYRKLEHTWKVENVDEALVKKHLSNYALTDYAEFEAELNAAIMRGKVLPKELLSYSHMNQVDTPLAKRMLSLASGDSVCLPSEEVSKGFKDAMKVLFHQKGSSFSIDIMADKNIQNLIEAHTSVLDRNLQRLEMSDLMRQSLTRSNYIFSGIKTFHELNEAFPSLLDSNGNRKTFEQFLNDVQRIDSTYNRNYLRAEYNFVQASAEMAAKWERFSEDGDRYNLQYRTQRDNKVRPQHAALDRVTLPMSDPFWQEYYPPNGWNCRCTVVQVRKSKYPVTPHDEAMALGEEATGKDTKGIFHFNPGIEKKTIPDYNPYTIKRCRDCDIAKGKLKLAFVPDNELCQACRLIRTMNRGQNNAEYNRLLNNPSYKDVQYHEPSGGVKATHNDHSFDSNKGWYEKKVQTAGFISGHSVILEAEYHNIYRHRNCEGLWDGLPFEIAGAENGTANNIRNALKHCAKKPGSKVAVIYFPNGNFNVEEFNSGLAKFNGLKGTSQYKLFDFIYCVQGENIVQIKKPSV